MLGKVQTTFPYQVVLNNSLTEQDSISFGMPPIFLKPKDNVTSELFRRYEYLNDDTLYSLRKTSSPQHLPDGAVTFKSANYK